MTLTTRRYLTNNKKRGFTIIELLIAVAIIVILVFLILFISSGQIVERQLVNFAFQIREDLLFVQNKAITYSMGQSSKSFEIFFYPQLNKYYIEYDYNAVFNPNTKTASGNVLVRTLPSSFGFPAYFGITTFESAKVNTNIVTSGYISIFFDYQGLPYWSINGGSLQQTSGYIILTNSTQSKVIKVNISPIGSVTIEWVKK